MTKKINLIMFSYDYQYDLSLLILISILILINTNIMDIKKMLICLFRMKKEKNEIIMRIRNNQ